MHSKSRARTRGGRPPRSDGAEPILTTERAGWAFLLSVALSLQACSGPTPSPVVDGFLKAYNDHDWSAAAAFLAEDVTFEGPDHDPIVGAAKVTSRLSWGTTLGSVWTLDDWHVSGDTARAAAMVERSEALRLMGVDEVHHEPGSMFVTQGGRVVHVIVSARVPASEAAVQEAMEAFVPWARHEYRHRLERILPGEEFDYQERRAADWLSLLAEWRSGER